MKHSFLQKIAVEIVKQPDFYQKIIVLPNKRAGVFLKKAIAELVEKPVISPNIISIDAFVEQYSPFRKVEFLPLLFELFQVYKTIYKDKAQSFDEFIKWAPYILQDFNEIDTFGIDAKKVFTYINEVKKIEDWQLKPESPKLITDYLKFYASLYDLYKGLQDSLAAKNWAYQGMIYNYIADHIDVISQQFGANTLCFVGFNSLNQSEDRIIKYLIAENKARTFWDTDKYYLKPQFEASLFLRKYKQEYQPFNWIFDNFKNPKHFEIIGVPGLTAQAQVVAKMVDEKLQKTTGNNVGLVMDTAVVLNEDTALLPIINALPESLKAVNITLGLPVGQLPITQIFEQIVKINYEFEQFGRYNVDTIAGLIHQPYLEQLFTDKEREQNEALLQKISGFKTKMISQKLLLELVQDGGSFIKKLFAKKYDATDLLALFFELIDIFSQKNIHKIDRLALVKLEEIFSELSDFMKQTGEVKNTATLQTLFRKLLVKERMAFEGEPLQGLQIMGILETRLLDFDHVIITSMNEGVIPKGKSGHSVIPFELKKHFGLPMHREQNSVIAYHFYRLLQRASKITLLYNTNDSGLGTNEQSRFITQLENELDTSIHTIEKKQLKLSANVNDFEMETIPKNASIINKLYEIADRGFSPSALTTYITNPLRYYQRYILNLQEAEEIADVIPPNVFGTIIHDAMEEIYKPFVAKKLSQDDFKNILKSYEAVATKHFMRQVFGEDLKKSMTIEGNNLIAFEIIKKNVGDLIKHDFSLLKAGKTFEIVSVENTVKATLSINDKKVVIKGKVDRIDRVNGQLRIIDYKTGVVKPASVSTSKNAESLDELITNPDKAKLFQLLTYAWLVYRANLVSDSDFPLQTGILSTRNIRQGVFTGKVFNEKEISKDVLMQFEIQLKNIISEILDINVAFVEKESKW